MCFAPQFVCRLFQRCHWITLLAPRTGLLCRTMLGSCLRPGGRGPAAGNAAPHMVSHLLPVLNSSQFLLFTPLRAFLSYAVAQLGVPGSWVCSWLQYLNFPPCVIKLPKLPAVIGFQYLYFPPSHETLATCNKTWAFILFQYLNFLPAAPQQLPAFIWFHI